MCLSIMRTEIAERGCRMEGNGNKAVSEREQERD